jgi:hypothetical protein
MVAILTTISRIIVNPTVSIIRDLLNEILPTDLIPDVGLQRHISLLDTLRIRLQEHQFLLDALVLRNRQDQETGRQYLLRLTDRHPITDIRSKDTLIPSHPNPIPLHICQPIGAPLLILSTKHQVMDTFEELQMFHLNVNVKSNVKEMLTVTSAGFRRRRYHPLFDSHLP